jgi:hypothetical protein
MAARRTKLRAYPARGRSGVGEHALAALESFSMAGIASCHPATVERGIREFRALLAVARAAGEADILHDGPHEVGTAPKACAGCRLMRALSRASSWEGGGTR